MRVFLRALSSIIFDTSDSIFIPTASFKSFRFGIPIYAGARLTPELSHLALRAKEDNDLMARKFLARLISDAVDLTQHQDLAVVLVPSRREANRNRGIKHINELVKEVSKLKELKSYDILRHTRKIRDQSTLSHRERMENLDGAFELQPTNKVPSCAFLIDDLVTTGATIYAAAQALQVRNIQVSGVITACATTVFTE